MEQRDSLKGELQNLARLQNEQVSILKDMSGKQSEQVTLEQAKQVHQQANFNTPGMYQYAAPSQANPFGSPYNMASPFGNPYGGGSSFNIGGKFGFMDVFSPGSKVSNTGRTLLAMDEGSKIARAGVTLAGAGLSYGASSALGALAPGLAGVGLSMFGGAAVGLAVDASVDEIKKNNALKKYIYKNSSKFIDPFETNNERGVAGFSREESADAANFIRTMNDELFVSDDDMMMMLQKFTEGGLLKETKDLDTFKEKMVSLSKTVKEGALMLNETYDSIADLMAEMRAAGIDEKSFKDLMSSGGILGSLLGADGSETLRDFLDWVKNLNAGTGNDNETTYNRLENTSIYMSKWFEELKNKDPKDMSFTEKQNLNMIENLGGAAEASKYTLSLMEKMVEKEQFRNTGLYFYDYNEEKKEFEFNQENFNKFKKGNLSLQELNDDASRKLNELRENGNGNAVTLWENQYSSYFKDSLKDGDMADFVSSVLNAYTRDPEMIANGYDYKGILSMLGVKDAGNQNLLTGFLDFKGSNPNLAKIVKFQDIWQQQTATQLAETPSFTERIKSGWEGVKDWFTQGAVDFDNGLGNMMQKVQDWLSGYKPLPKFDNTFTKKSDIENYTFEEVLDKTKQTNDELAAGFNSLKQLQEKGYTVNQDLYKFMENKFNVAEKTVNYDRDVITDWNQVSKDLQESKDLITQIAEKNDLSETIVAALFKYNQTKPKEEQLDITTVDSSFNTSLGDNLFNYGGNNQLALAASLTSTETIDNALNRLGYNIEGLRSVGAQESLVNVTLDGLGLDEEITNKIMEIINQNIGGGSGSSGGDIYVPETLEDAYNKKLTEQSNVTAEDLNKIINDNTADKPNSMMKGMGETIIAAAEETGLDAMYLLNHAALETGWGTSGILNGKYNWFGIGAYNSSPYESAYKFGDKNLGFIEGAKWIKENYTDQGQDTLALMVGVPGHNYAVNDDGTPNLSWRDNQANMMIYGLNKVGKGYGAGSADEEDSGPVKTDKVKVNKNQDGSDMTEEQIQKAAEQIWVEEGFKDQSTQTYNSLNSFLKQVGVTEKLRTETSEERSDRVMRKLVDYEMSGAFVELNKFNDANNDIEDNKQQAERLVTELLEMIDEKLSSNAYGDIDDMLEKDKDVQKKIKKIKTNFKDEDAADEFVNEILDQKQVMVGGEIKDGMGQYEILQAFGQQFLGLDKRGMIEDTAEYNFKLNTGVEDFYKSNLQLLTGFLGGDKESAEYKVWASKTASEQEAIVDTLKKLEFALGKDGENSEVNKVMEGKTNDDIHTEEDNYRKKYIHKDDRGGYYYDESKESENTISWSEYNEWVEGGERRLNYGTIGKLLSNNDMSFADDSGVALSIEKLIQTAQENMNKVSEEQYKLINGTANDYAKNLLEQKQSLISMSNSEINGVNSGNEELVAQANSAYEQFLKQIGNMIKVGDAEGLRNLRQTEAENGRTFNDEVFNKYIELAEKIDSMDANEFMKIINGLNEIIDRSSDLVDAAALFTGADGKGEGGLGAGFSETFSDQLITSITAAFKDTDFGNDVSKGKYDIAEIYELVKQGGVKDGEVILSAESLDKMTLALSDALNVTFDERLNTTGGVDEFANSDLVQQFKDGITIKVGDSDLNLEDALGELKELVSKGTEITADELSKKDEIVEQVKVAFQEQVADVGEVSDEAKSDLDEVTGKTKDTVQGFVSAIEEYDGAMQSAIKTLGGSITTINKDVQSVKDDVEGLKWYNKLGRSISNAFGGNSNGDSVTPGS